MLDMFYVDLKCMDPEAHKKWTGQDNTRILENLRLADSICRSGAIHVRIPVVEGVNDSEENIRKTADFCGTLENCAELEFLPYHRLGIHAYRQLQRQYALEDRKPMNRWNVYERMRFLCEENRSFDISISGFPVYSREKGVLPVTREELEA